MNKKTLGILIATLLIGSLVIIMVKSNTNAVKPITNHLIDENGNSTDALPGLKKGQTPPDFDLATPSGEDIKLSDYKGKKVILNFWASWCGPCKAEMPHMQNYYEKNKESDNVEIIAVNMTTEERRGLKGVEEFIKSYGLTFPIPLDSEGTVSDAYQVAIIPTTYIIGTDGKISQRVVGPMDEKILETIIKNSD